MADKNLQKRSGTRPTVRACCDVLENDGEITLKLEMPGVTKDGLNVNIDGDQLEIRGMRDVKRLEGGNYLIHEIREADFYQVYTIDETIDRNKIDASLKHGILTLKLGVKESQKPRKIEIAAK
ncbi:Hsp20/alpha crystallin family protein [Marispirochaeta aestuarii]|uniref:Hsp20/alpha crystallin family protein n=1 Tax=Marispirochaeta aestuarii TaxID=1963862 RepID=UPI002ABE96A2|nr:Hsp20/alpha crystallin family protein [Marispirochaeta aestuarii]